MSHLAESIGGICWPAAVRKQYNRVGSTFVAAGKLHSNGEVVGGKVGFLFNELNAFCTTKQDVLRLQSASLLCIFKVVREERS